MKIVYQTGFSQIPNKIIRSHVLTPMQKIVLMVLCSYANDNNIAFPSYKTIAADSGYSRRKVIDVIGELIELGCIRKIERKTAKGDNAANDYEVLIGGEGFTLPDEDNSEGGAQRAPGGSACHSPGGAQHSPGGGACGAPGSAHGAPEQYLYNNIKLYNNIYQSNPDNSKPEDAEGWKDRYNKTITELHKQLDYDYLVSVAERERVDEIVNIMADVMLNYRPKYKIEGETIDYEAVVCNFSKVTAQKLEACLLAYRRRSKKIHNTKAYWITVLYNIPLTSSLALENMVMSDLQAVGG